MLCAPSVKDAAAQVKFPVYASPKRDGMRAIIAPHGPRTRKLKKIGNDHVRNMLGQLPIGLDGELVVQHADGTDNFRGTGSAVRSFGGVPVFKYYVFDIMVAEPFKMRLKRLELMDKQLPMWVRLLPQRFITNPSELAAYYAYCLDNKDEGICLRKPNGYYKHGRATLVGQELMRMKEYETDEAVVIGITEEMENCNEPENGPDGYQTRSTHMDGLIGKGRMGALVCRSAKFTHTFNIGSGFTHQDRIDLWRNSPVGKIAHYRYDPKGGHDARPRQPVFKGFREGDDL